MLHRASQAITGKAVILNLMACMESDRRSYKVFPFPFLKPTPARPMEGEMMEDSPHAEFRSSPSEFFCPSKSFSTREGASFYDHPMTLYWGCRQTPKKVVFR